MEYNLGIEKIHSLNLQCNSWRTYLKYGGNRRAFFLLTSTLTLPWTWGQASPCLGRRESRACVSVEARASRLSL